MLGITGDTGVLEVVDGVITGVVGLFVDDVFVDAVFVDTVVGAYDVVM